ncbi:MAG: CPBP family intramembrane metalloprotease [Muribaculaceae bacterium]|nr:CPBP family intramembrane metalloprotease [Muribaculaceae bacterium]
MKKSDLLLSLGRRLWLLLCLFIVGYAVCVGISIVLNKVLQNNAAAYLRISMVVQDLCVFAIPAIGTACMICRKPADLLGLMKGGSAQAYFAVFAILFFSIPLMETIVYWNAHLHFPPSMEAFEKVAREMEETASSLTETLLRSNTSIIGLIVNLLIIGVLAGFSEELLFRGCFQRLLTTGGVNVHVSIWTVAFVFSAFHFQVFGFVPRLLLGAYFGYLMLWTGSVRVPMLAHILNNSIYVIIAWLQLLKDPNVLLSSSDAGELYSWPVVLCSVIATSAALVSLKLSSKRQ